MLKRLGQKVAQEIKTIPIIGRILLCLLTAFVILMIVELLKEGNFWELVGMVLIVIGISAGMSFLFKKAKQL